MNESDKKSVTLWLGECWHEFKPEEREFVCKHTTVTVCGKCGRFWESFAGGKQYRTFTTWEDFGACWERLEGNGEQRVLQDFAESEWYYKSKKIFDFIPYLLSTTEDGTFRLCNLIAEALKEGVI